MSKLPRIAPNPMPPVVGFTGVAESGKDTAALALEPHGFRHESFAGPLKELALEIDPWINLDGAGLPEPNSGTFDPLDHGLITSIRLRDLWETFGPRAAKSQTQVRELLQLIGHFIRGLDEHFWVNIMDRKIEASAEPVVITDVRYDNEARLIRSFGGKVIKLIRPGHGPANDHPSEQGVSPWLIDAVIDNDQDQETLWKRVCYIALGVEYKEPRTPVLLTHKSDAGESTEVITTW